MGSDSIRLGTRGSKLARWQTEHIQKLLHAAWPDKQFEVEVFTTRGDKILDTPLPLIGGKGLFTAELENALRNGDIDLAVHSLKDLPTEEPEGLTVGAVPQRATVADVLVSRNGRPLDALPKGATIGTSSTRRAAQLRHYRSDFQTADIRGNVETRIRKALDPDGDYDATVLAYAGLERLERLNVVTEVLPAAVMLPAPGQGALGVQCRKDAQSLALLAPINHRETRLAVTAERAFLAGLGGGCAVPIAAYGSVEDGQLQLHGRVSALDGSSQIDVEIIAALTGESESDLQTAQDVGKTLAQQALEQGAQAILEAL